MSNKEKYVEAFINSLGIEKEDAGEESQKNINNY